MSSGLIYNESQSAERERERGGGRFSGPNSSLRFGDQSTHTTTNWPPSSSGSRARISLCCFTNTHTHQEQHSTVESQPAVCHTWNTANPHTAESCCCNEMWRWSRRVSAAPHTVINAHSQTWNFLQLRHYWSLQTPDTWDGTTFLLFGDYWDQILTETGNILRSKAQAVVTVRTLTFKLLCWLFFQQEIKEKHILTRQQL